MTVSLYNELLVYSDRLLAVPRGPRGLLPVRVHSYEMDRLGRTTGAV